jgi:dTDP-4-dehydrorhamnose 3,5-epimerase
MEILEVKALAIPDLRVIRFGRFRDSRGYFTEPYRRGDLDKHPQTAFFKGLSIVQANESWSRAGTIRGLHFQWNPYMGKLVRTLSGQMVDLALDIRKGSPTCGKIVAYDMPAAPDRKFDEWIWVPPGFAHGNYFPHQAARAAFHRLLPIWTGRLPQPISPRISVPSCRITRW